MRGPGGQTIAGAMAAADRFNQQPPSVHRRDSAEAGATPGPLTLRRWESADSSRLNSAHWGRVNGRPINEDLAGQLGTLRARARHEAANNALVDGMLRTHALDWVGPTGPRLTINSDSDPTFEADARALWESWFARPTICGTVPGPTLLQQWVRTLWTDGEHLSQIVTDRRAEMAGEAVTSKIKPLDPALLRNPTDRSGRNIALGVERDEDGRPVRYHVADYQQFGAFRVGGYLTKPQPADVILHEFLPLEADQVRGVPWLSSSLQVIADLRDYDTQVLDAARAAADWGVYLWTQHPDAPFFLIDDEAEIERRMVRTLPPGYQPEQMRPEQPTTRYVDYRRERLAELGRAVSMPLMLIRLSAENHSYSSARLDLQMYARGLASYQFWMGCTLTRLLRLITTEAYLAGQLGRWPADARVVWGWPGMPHVDPTKEATAERTRLESGTLALQDACAQAGQSIDDLIAKRKADNAQLAAAGLPPVPLPGSATGANAADQAAADAADAADQAAVDAANAADRAAADAAYNRGQRHVAA